MANYDVSTILLPLQEGFLRGNTRWYWELDPKMSPKAPTHGDVTTFVENQAVSPTQSTTSSKVVTPQPVTTFAGVEDDPEVGLV